MNDLLTDSFVLSQREDPKDNDIEMGRTNRKNPAQLMLESFFKQVNEVEKQIDKLSKLLKKLQDANEEYKALTKAESMKAIRQQMAKDIDEVGKIALATKRKIEALDKDNLTNRQKPECGPGTGIDRSRTSNTIALTKKYQEKMSEFQTLRNTIHQDHRELVERRVFTAFHNTLVRMTFYWFVLPCKVTGNHADEETIDRLIETGQSERIFQKAIQEQGRGQVLDTLNEIQERHDIVREIERKLLELQQVFMDMSVLVETQGDMLDNIESHVSTAVDHVNSATVALRKANSLRRNSRKWMCIAIIILLIIIAVIVLGVVKPWQSSSNSNSSSNNTNNGRSG